MASTKNIYEHGVDFSALAMQDAEFARMLKTNGQLDFSDPVSVQQLTKSLLKRDFKLQLTLADDRLCPPVPNRLNYLLWIQDLVESTGNSDEKTHQNDVVLGMDIGTGASCIYPLLGCAMHPTWRFVATEIDEKSLNIAEKNVSTNAMSTRIKLHRSKTGVEASILPFDEINIAHVDFTMCNPPFYASTAELVSSASLKQRPPSSACTGAPIEMVCDGGEVAFVLKMLEESASLRTRARWFTSMLGKLSSIVSIVGRIQAFGIENWAVTEFVQGNKTRRWAVAWSYMDFRPTSKLARGIQSLPKHLMPFPTEHSFNVRTDLNGLIIRLEVIMHNLGLEWQWDNVRKRGTCYAIQNVWARAARRHKQTEEEQMDHDQVLPKLGVHVGLQEFQDSTSINIQWFRGHDTVLFESFCGMLKRGLS